MHTAFLRKMVLGTLASLTLFGCDSSAQPMAPPAFPKGFLFGVATAGFQNDAGCPSIAKSECIDSHSDWYHFVTDPLLLASDHTYLSGDSLDAAPGSYELFERDFDLVKNELHGNAVRLSLEWSRLFPRSTFDLAPTDLDGLRGRADPIAVAHYHRVFAALKARGLKPLVTLNHYTLPDWIHDTVACYKDLKTCSPSGWLDSTRTVAEITKYAAFAAHEFGGEVDLWATLNEPFAVVLPAFIAPSPDRTNPPAVPFAFDAARTALWAMVEANARMYDAVKNGDTVDADGDGQASTVGLVYNLTPAVPRDPTSARDVQGAKNFFYLYNEVFLNAVMRGDVDLNLDGVISHRSDLGGKLDYLGINYYTQAIVDGADSPFFAGLSPLTTFNPLTSTIYTETPQGIADMVKWTNDRGYPAFITENGSSDPSDAEVSPRYLVRHLTALQQATASGARVGGYFYWTLVDNYEWNHGMQMQFGLYALDGSPQKMRTPRTAAGVYGQIAASGVLSDELRQKYPLLPTP